HSDFVASVTTVEHGDKAIVRVHSDIDREIAEHDLFANRPKGPLIGEQDRAIGALPGQIGRRLTRGLRRMSYTSCEQQQSSHREELQRGSHKSSAVFMPAGNACVKVQPGWSAGHRHGAFARARTKAAVPEAGAPPLLSW